MKKNRFENFGYIITRQKVGSNYIYNLVNFNYLKFSIIQIVFAISCKHSETQYVLVYLFFIDDFASLEN